MGQAIDSTAVQTRPRGPIGADQALVEASGLAWVIVRPTVLNDKPATGKVLATVDLTNIHGGSIPRADVAGFVLDQLTTEQWIGKTPLITARNDRFPN